MRKEKSRLLQATNADFAIAISKLNLVIYMYNQAVFILNPSKRKDCKGEGLAQICQKITL